MSAWRPEAWAARWQGASRPVRRAGKMSRMETDRAAGWTDYALTTMTDPADQQSRLHWDAGYAHGYRDGLAAGSDGPWDRAMSWFAVICGVMALAVTFIELAAGAHLL